MKYSLTLLYVNAYCAAMRERMSRVEQREQTRLRLLDATVGVIRQRGWADASIDAIAELAGYTRGAFYFHFASKEQAALEAVEHYAEPAFEDLRRRGAAAKTADDLIALLTAMIGPDGEAARAAVARRQAIRGIFRDPELGPRAVALQHSSELALGDVLAGFCARLGRPAPMPPAELGALFTALVDGLGARLAIDPYPDARELMRRAVHLLIDSPHE